MSRIETTRSHVKITTVNSKSGELVDEITHQIDAGCCSFISRLANSNSDKSVDIHMLTKIRRDTIDPGKEQNNDEFIVKWIDFINSLGFSLKVKFNKVHIDVTLQKQILSTNYYFLFALNVVRYLWSTHYDHLPSIILNLREDKSLKSLSNWEIFQLGHAVASVNKKHFNDMSPIQEYKLDRSWYITSEEFFKRRQFVHLNGHLSTFNIPMPKSCHKKIAKLVEDKDYIGIYNLLSTKVNNIEEVSKAICIDNNGFDKELNLNEGYEIVRSLKNTVKVKNKNYKLKLYNKKRFKLV